MDFSVLKNIIEQPENSFVCPLCHSPFSASGNSVRCPDGHSYNFTKPGTINFITKKMNCRDAAFYDNELKLHQMAPWQNLIESIKEELSVKDRICFTGSSLSSFLKAGDLGFEASSLSVIRQLRQMPERNLFIAEAAKLPVATESKNLVLRLDEQTDMVETLRILKPDHFMVRILPGQKHLLEVRQQLFGGRRLGLRENQNLLKFIWSMESPLVFVTHQRIRLTHVPDEKELNIIIHSLAKEPGPDCLFKIRQQVRTVTFDFEIYYIKKQSPNNI